MKILAHAVVAALVSTMLSLGLSVGPADAANRTPGCVTKSEFRNIKRHFPIQRVRKIVGHRGRVQSSSTFSDGDAWTTLSFRQCKKRWSTSSVSVSFEKTERRVWVPNLVCFDWDGDGYEEDCEDYGYYKTVYRAPMIVTSKYAFWF